MSTKEARSPQDILREPYARILTPGEDGTYTAEILEFPGCYAEGDTAQEAIVNLENAALSWIEAALEQGQDIPSPIEAHGHSGRISLRLAKSVHKQAARFAERDQISLNQFFSTAIAARVGAEEFYEYFTAPSTAENAPTPIHGGFALTHWSGDPEIEAKIAEDLSVTVRCIPLEDLGDGEGICPFDGQPSEKRVVWAKAY